VLRRLGAEVRPVRLSPLARFTDCGRTIHFAEAFAVHERDSPAATGGLRRGDPPQAVAGAFIPAVDYVKEQQLRTCCAGNSTR